VRLCVPVCVVKGWGHAGAERLAAWQAPSGCTTRTGEHTAHTYADACAYRVFACLPAVVLDDVPDFYGPGGSPPSVQATAAVPPHRRRRVP
jgi:hypothetical protein